MAPKLCAVKNFQPLLLATGLVCLTTPSFAGQWQLVRFECNGSSSGQNSGAYSGNPQVGVPESCTYAFPASGWPAQMFATPQAPQVRFYAQSQSAQGSTPTTPLDVSVATSGTIAPVFRWVPDVGQTLQSQPPPLQLNARLGLDASVAANNWGNDNALTVNEAGLSNSLPWSQLQENYDDSDWPTVSHSFRRHGYVLVQADNSGREAEVKVPGRTLNAQGRLHGTYQAGVAANVVMVAQIDTRSVKLTRERGPNAPAPLTENVWDENTQKSKLNLNLNKNRDEWVAGDGTGHGHTLASYKERVLLSNGGSSDDPLDVTQVITAQRSGSWSPVSSLVYKWFLSQADNPNQANPNIDFSEVWSNVLSEDINSQTKQMVRSNAINNPEGIGVIGSSASGFIYATNATPKGWINHASNRKGDVVLFQYDLTDTAGTATTTDDATATAKYELMLHDEWENALPDPDRKYNIDGTGPKEGYGVEQRYQVYGTPGLPPLVATIDSTDPDWVIKAGDKIELTAGFEVSGGFKAKDFANANFSLGGTFTKTLEASIGVGAPALSMFTDPIPPSTTPRTLPPSTKFVPVISFTMLRRCLLVDKFGVNGWIANSGKTKNADGTDIPKTDDRYGKWPQSKDEAIRDYTPDWLIIYGYENLATPPSGATGKFDSLKGRS